MNENSAAESERAGFSLEIGDLARYARIIAASFILAAVISAWAKSLLKNNAGLTVLLGITLFASAFFAMRFARMHVKTYVERYGWLVIPPALAAMFLFSSVKPVVFIILFLVHALACFFLRALKNTARLGIELIMLITVLGSFVYGARTGALLGAAAMLMDYALAARFSYFVPITTAAYALIGLAAGSFSASGITAVGIAATIIYNIVTSFIIVAFMGGHLEKCLRFGLSNIALNFVLFTAVAPKLLSILT